MLYSKHHHHLLFCLMYQRNIASYENCMELLTDEYQPPTLNRFFGEDEDTDDGVDIQNAEWKKHS